MKLKTYLIGTKEEIEGDIEKKVNSYRDGIKYGFKSVLFQGAHAALLCGMVYTMADPESIGASFDAIEKVKFFGSMLVFAEYIPRVVCVPKSLMALGSLNKNNEDIDDSTSAEKGIEHAKAHSAPGLIGIIRKYKK